MALQLFTPPLRSQSVLLSSEKVVQVGWKKPPQATDLTRLVVAFTSALPRRATSGVNHLGRCERNLSLKSNANVSSALRMR